MISPETVQLARAQPAASSNERLRLRVLARPLAARIRRDLGRSPAGRTWVLEIEVEVPDIDAERVLATCEGFLVDGIDGREIGVVETVEESRAGAAASLVISAGALRRRALRIDARDVSVLVPAERRLIVDASRATAVAGRDRRS